MKVYDFRKKDIDEIPIIKEEESFELKLDNNFISIFENIPKLCYSLSLSYNKVSYLSKKLTSENNIKILDLSFNRLISLSGFEKLSRVYELNISNNYITDDQLLFLKNLSELKIINLAGNNLKTNIVTIILKNIPSIEKLNLSNNHLENLKFKAETTEMGYTMLNLKHLELDSNKLGSLVFESECEESFSALTYLSISNNKMTKINLENLKNLKILIANDNSLSDILEIDLLCSLETMDFSNNTFKLFKFRDITTIIPSLNNLSNLNISFNNIEDLKSLVKNLKHLKILNNLKMMENEFNRDFYYNISDITSKNYQSLEEYLNGIKNANLNKKRLIDYRAYIILKLPSINKLDFISISENERKDLLKIIKDNSYLSSNSDSILSNKKNLNFSNNKSIRNFIQTESSINYSKLEEEIDKKIENINRQPNIDKKIENINRQPNIDKKIENINRQPTIERIKSDEYIDDEKKLNKLSSISKDSNKSQAKQTIYSENLKKLYHIYKLIKKIFCRICDKNGYLKLSDCKSLIKELVKLYAHTEEFKFLLKDIATVCNAKNNIFQGKLHMNDFSSILKNEKHLIILEVISYKLEQNQKDSNQKESEINISIDDINQTHSHKCINVNANNLSNISSISNSEVISPSNLQLNGSNISFRKLELVTSVENSNTEFHNEKPIKPFTCLRNATTTPLLIIKDKNNKNISTNVNSKNYLHLNCNYQNVLLSSISSLAWSSSIEMNVNDKKFLSKFLNVIFSPPFPIKKTEQSKRLYYEIHANEKEYNFLENFFKIFGIEKFRLKKFFCHEYINSIFYYNFDSCEFTFENTIYFFYTKCTNEIFDFMSGEHACNKLKYNNEIILEENPIKCLHNHLNLNRDMNINQRLVLCIMTHKNSVENKKITEK